MRSVRTFAALCTFVLASLVPVEAAAADEADEERCLALAVYWEARTETLQGMLAVASVVLNRVRHSQFPDTVCGVVQQGGEAPPCQFSWWCDGKADVPEAGHAWWRAQAIAHAVLRHPPYDRTAGALFFHADYIPIPWTMPRTRTVQIGDHIFYR